MISEDDQIRDMLSLVKARGLKLKAVVMDTWYAFLNKLKAICSHGWTWKTTLRKNRKINRNEILSEINIPDDAANVHLRGYGLLLLSL